MYITERSLDTLVKKISEDSSIADIDRTSIPRFLNEAVTQQIGLLQRRNYAVRLYVLARRAKKPLSTMKKEDVKELVADIERGPWQPVSKKNVKNVVKKYFQWVAGHEWNSKEFPETVKWLRCGIKRCQKKLPEDILTKDEVLKLVDASDSIQNKAIVFALYESGCRVGEFANLRIKDVAFDKYGAKLHVTKGKTGSRVVRIITSASFIAQWLSCHPFKDNRESYLWINYRKEPMGYAGFTIILKKLKQKIKLQKKLHPHALRHARASHLASTLTHAELCQFFGWTMASAMPNVYIHINGETIERKLLEDYGIVDDEAKVEEKLKMLPCPRCTFANLPNGSLCSNCGLPLNDESAMRAEKIQKETTNLVDKNMLSEMIKKIVLEEMDGRDGVSRRD